MTLRDARSGDRGARYRARISTPSVNDSITASLQSWTQGNQQAAVDALRVHADAGERSALLLIAWFLSQMGQPSWSEGAAYAHRAAQAGIPQAATYLFGQVLGDATLRNQAPQLAREAIEAGWSLDPLPNALSVYQQGDPATAVALVEAAAAPRPYPDAWAELLQNANADLEALRNAAGEVATRRDAAIASIDENDAALKADGPTLNSAPEACSTS